MNESEFISLIDARFPYGNPEEWRRLIRLGAEISANAAFMTLHEICIPPRSAKVTQSQQLEMIDYWGSQCAHPLADEIRRVAVFRIWGNRLQLADAKRLFELVAEYPRQYNALNIVYLSCGEFDDFADDARSRIVEHWASD